MQRQMILSRWAQACLQCYPMSIFFVLLNWMLIFAYLFHMAGVHLNDDIKCNPEISWINCMLLYFLVMICVVPVCVAIVWMIIWQTLVVCFPTTYGIWMDSGGNCHSMRMLIMPTPTAPPYTNNV